MDYQWHSMAHGNGNIKLVGGAITILKNMSQWEG
jgi:hypothetical protein